MNQDRLYIDYLRDILEHAEKSQNFVAGMTQEEFLGDDKTVFAVIRALEVVGEASKKVPQAVKEEYAHVPWREMAGTRDKLIHDYFGVNRVVIWKTATEDIPELLPMIRQILASETAK
jgi:uncharacterized protein with HEPN domain